MPKRMGKYELGRVLGTGNFSKVRAGTDTTTGEVYAVKVIEKAQLAKERLEEQLKREIAVLKILRHKHVVAMKEVLQTTRHIYIVLELVNGGELFDRIVQAQRFPEDEARKYFQHLILGVRYCHLQNIAHRDLKPENLLLDNGTIKISDFGLANLSNTNEDLMQTVCGTPNYVAPEVIRDRGYNGFAADIWSCGIILYVMLSGHQAFEDVNVKALFNKIERGDYRMSRHFSDGAKDLISKILVVDPSQRYTINQIIAHPWFQVGFDPGELTTSDLINVSQTQVTQSLTDVEDPASPTEGGLGGEDGFALAQRLMSAQFAPLVRASLPAASGGPTPAQQPSGVYHRSLFFRGTAGEAVKDLSEALKKVSPGLNSKTNGDERNESGVVEIRGFVNARRGLVTFLAEVTPTVLPSLTLIEMKKGRGDANDFAELVQTVHTVLDKKVASTPLDT